MEDEKHGMTVGLPDTSWHWTHYKHPAQKEITALRAEVERQKDTLDSAGELIAAHSRQFEKAEQTIATLREWVAEQRCELHYRHPDATETCRELKEEDEWCMPCRARAAQGE
jgi:hypothetical protein